MVFGDSIIKMLMAPKYFNASLRAIVETLHD